MIHRRLDEKVNEKKEGILLNKTISIDLLGFGTVGKGVYDLLTRNKSKIQEAIGCELQIKKILVNNIKKHQSSLDKGIPLTDQFSDILQKEPLQIIVEVMGSMDVAKEYIIQSLRSGKHVVTANKDLLALAGDELLEIATEEGKGLRFEASVGGGIPIIRPLLDSFSGDNIEKVMGIINGTSNFMLTKMKEDHLSYEEALEMAQKLGFAESDPSADVDGIDAARKIIILSQLAFGKKVLVEEMDVTGISHIKSEDFLIAESQRSTIKLLAFSEMKNEQLWTEVAPMFVPLGHPLAFVKNENNAVYVKSEAVGETMFYGPGAGMYPTANSVVSDIIAIAKDMNKNVQTKNPVFQSQATLLNNESSSTDVVVRFEKKEKIESVPNHLLDQLKSMALDVTSLSVGNHQTNNLYFKIKNLPRSKWVDLKKRFSSDDFYVLDAIFPII